MVNTWIDGKHVNIEKGEDFWIPQSQYYYDDLF